MNREKLLGCSIINIVIILLFFSSCGKNKQELSCDTDVPNDSVPVIETFGKPIIFDVKNDYPQKTITFQDIADVEYVSLETSEEALVGQDAVFSVYKKVIICANYSSGEIMFFNRNGNLLSLFNHKGGSGKEYTLISSYTYDEKNDELFILDYNPLRRILVYSANGVFKREIKINKKDRYITKILNYDENTLITRKKYLLDAELLKNKEAVKDYCMISKKDGSIVSFINLKLVNSIPTFLQRGENMFARCFTQKDIFNAENKTFIADISSDTIFRLNSNGGLIPFIVRKPSINESTPPNVLLVPIMNDRYVFVTKFKYDYLSEKSPGLYNVFDYIIEINDRKISCVKFINNDFSNDEKDLYQYQFMDIETSWNNAASIYTAETLVNALRKNALKGKLKEISTTLHEEDNPVIMILNLR